MPRPPIEIMQEELNGVTLDRLNTTRSLRSIQAHGSPHTIVRLPPPRRAPYCSYHKLQKQKLRTISALGKMRQEPYFTSWERDRREEAERRAKFINGPFVVTDHRAAVAKREVAMLNGVQ